MKSGRKFQAVVSFRPGDEAYFQGRRYVITKTLDLGHVLGRDPETKEVRTLPVSELESRPDNPPSPPEVSSRGDLSAISEKDWKTAERRLEIIRPLLNDPDCTLESVKKRASESGLHFNTVYTWLRAYEREGTLSSLLRRGRNDSGKSRLEEEVDAIIQGAIETIFLTPQRKSVQKVVEAVRKQCRAAGLDPPHANTVRSRVAKVREEKKIASRWGKRRAKEAFSPIAGHFPGADRPLAYVQIDHTRLDVQVVDSVHRLPIGRPWITLAIDVFSRMVLGIYVTMDPPSSMSVGLCLAHACFPKEAWLAKLGVEGTWPCWGLMETLHADNGSDFRGETLARACAEYGIRIEWRPVKKPEFGGHIERLLGTILREVHTLPGTTFSNPKEKGKAYNPEKTAAFTLPEFEKWLATFITGIYHKKVHSTLGKTPEEKYEEGIVGTKGKPGVGLPRRPSDEARFRLDFMPFIKRTIQSYGVVIDDVHYYHEVLRPWINARVPGKERARRSFIFKRDPRDISKLWFLEPDLNQYFEVPYRNLSLPSISLWDLKEARRVLKDQGREADERSLFEAYDRLSRIEEQAVSKSKKARRNSQRKREREAGWKERKDTQETPITPEAPETLPDLEPFEEIVEMGHA